MTITLLVGVVLVRWWIAVSKPLPGLPSLKPSFPLGKYHICIPLHILLVAVDLCVVILRRSVCSADHSLRVVALR